MSKNENQETPYTEQAVSILGQFIKDLSFENPDPMIFANSTAQPNINMDVQVNVNNINEEHFEVVLNIKLTATQNEKTVFLAELAYSTIVHVNKNAIDKENINPILLVHIPHLSFPFVRAILFNLIRDGGLPAFTIHPIDFAGLYQQNLESSKQATKQ